ncbi:cadherin-like beta sandwich domain-containing protein [Microbacterium sp. 2FI]|uniref:cadherin-like beta sandwich domain-containing protein n=1 Tax=Microbacterium sp. 2FI TaxID=2502193 RepID=UPI0010F5D4E9|nr:cadherin-like beta sandwich domain-containing protein [Microbacterium sp. 2FI]
MRTRILAAITTGVLVMSGATVSAGAAHAAPGTASSTSAAAAAIPVGASFTTVADLGVVGSQTYLYQPSEKFNPAPMLTPVIFVYSDLGYASQDAALDALSGLGLVDLAEREKAVLIVQTPVGGAWGPGDVTVYQDVLRYIWGGNTAASGKPALSFFRLDYMIGEGAGATFINEHMTQAPNVNRIAGVATFGGAMPAVAQGSALPAYIVGGQPAAIDYYKSANEVDARVGGRFYNADNPAKEVIVSNAKSQRFEPSLIEDAYASLFSGTVRQGLSTPVFYDNATTTEDFTLMERPDLDALGLTQILVSGEETGATGQPRWYEWVPDEVLRAQRSASGKTYPLVLDLHGRGDHEIYEAESNGWIELAGEEKVIVVAPFDTATTPVVNMLEVIKAKYPVDTSRIYMTGYSAGGRATWAISSLYPETFAAIAPMSSPGSTVDAGLAAKNDLIDLPTFFSAAENERDAVQRPNASFPVPQVKVSNLNALTTYMRLNEISPPTTFDFAQYGIFGFPVEQPRDYVTRWDFLITAGTLSDDTGVPMMQIATGRNLDHTHYMDYAPIAWDYMSRFSRDTTTNEIRYAEDSELPALNSIQATGVTKGVVVQPAFDPAVTDYSLVVPGSVSSLNLKATAASGAATVSIAGRTPSTGTVVERVPLGAVGTSTPVDIVVTSADGIHLAYHVTVTRQG